MTQDEAMQVIADTASSYGVRPQLAIELAVEESGLNPDVHDGAAGEIGIMQIKPATAKPYGYSAQDLRDPVNNIDAGVHYLGDLLTKFNGDEASAVAAYNWGPTRVARKGAEAAPESTQNYVANILERAAGATGDYQLQAVGPFDTGTIVAWAIVIGVFAFVISEA